MKPLPPDVFLAARLGVAFDVSVFDTEERLLFEATLPVRVADTGCVTVSTRTRALRNGVPHRFVATLNSFRDEGYVSAGLYAIHPGTVVALVVTFTPHGTVASVLWL